MSLSTGRMMPKHSNIPAGRISMDDMAIRAGLTRRRIEHWTHSGYLEHEKDVTKARGRIHYDPSEARVAFVANLLLRLEWNYEDFILALKQVREWESDGNCYQLTDRIYVDLEGI